MIKIKHSKYKNTGLIYELLVRQIAADTISKSSSPAITILKEHFGGKSALSKELKLYEFISKNKGVSIQKADSILATILEISRRLDREVLKKQKYSLIKDLKESYDLDEFFSIKIGNYKPFAALYCILESYSTQEMVDPNSLVNNRGTLLEHLTNTKIDKSSIKDSLVEEYSKYDKDLKLLTYKILLEKFNSKYSNLLPQQKKILREFITSASSTVRLRTLVNTELVKLKEEIEKLSVLVEDDIIRIKLQETYKGIKLVDKKTTIKDHHLANLMRYYDLLEELKNL